MITQIKEIQDFGIFKNFQWSSVADLKDFNKKNIIYGRNYSGKTTLSRVFSTIRDKSKHTKYTNAKFKVIVDGQVFDETNLSKIQERIYVFNSEYISKNLKWEQDESLDSIAFDVGENIEIIKQILANNAKIDSINGTDTKKSRKDSYQAKIDQFNEFDNNKLTKEASRIKNDIFNSVIEFNKSHFKRIITELKNNDTSAVLLDAAKIDELKKQSIANNDKSHISLITYNSESLMKQWCVGISDVPLRMGLLQGKHKKKMLSIIILM
jgi:hypothetical protein